MVLWLTNQGPFVSPLPTDLKLHVQVQEATTRTKKKKLGRVKITRGDRGWGRQRTMETLFQFRPQNPQPRNQDGGFSNFGDLPERLRENQGHYKNTLETGSNFEFKMLTDIYLLSKKKPERFLWHEKYASFSDKRKLTQITT